MNLREQIATELFRNILGRPAWYETAGGVLKLCERLSPGFDFNKVHKSCDQKAWWNDAAGIWARHEIEVIPMKFKLRVRAIKTTNIIVVGDHDFSNFKFLKTSLDAIVKKLPRVAILVDGEWNIIKGKQQINYYSVSYWTESWAATNRDKCSIILKFHANPKKKNSSEKRYDQMIEHGTHAVVFWNGRDKATKGLIKKIKRAELKLRIVRYRDE